VREVAWRLLEKETTRLAKPHTEQSRNTSRYSCSLLAIARSISGEIERRERMVECRRRYVKALKTMMSTSGP